MSLLRTEPPAVVKSLDELFAIAHAMEFEAATRYAEFAERMRRENKPGLAAVFERLSADEKGHIDGIMRWSESEQAKAPDPALIRWQLPQTFDDEGISTIDPSLLSSYRALATAVRNEERAFAFWSYVAAQATSPKIQRAAETMAHEELGHVATLRRERRRAFHEARSEVRGTIRGRSGVDEAVDLERRLADLLDLRAGSATSGKRPHLKRLVEDARGYADELASSPIPMPTRTDAERAADDAVVIAELLADRYLEAADDLRDEGSLHRMQALAGRAVARLVWLRSDLPELEGP
jgi:rubrerythrin